MSKNKKIVGTTSLEKSIAKFMDENDIKMPATIWLDYYKQKLKESNQTFRDKGFEIIKKDLDRLEVYDKEHEETVKAVCEMEKVLQIIKEKRVDVFGLICCIKLNKNTALETYNLTENCHNYRLTPEEFNLLKEELL